MPKAADSFRGYIRWQIGRRFGGVDRALVGAYMATYPVRKLHIGCGLNQPVGWLNTDYFPDTHAVMHMDATRRFPFADATFDYAFTEHVIEHFTHAHGLAMLRECARVLKPGGRLRVSTPDLAFLVRLYAEDRTHLQRAYVKWAARDIGEYVPEDSATFVINNFVRAWGHKFIYDERTLRASMEAAGFAGIVRCRLMESDDAALRGLENVKRLPLGFLHLETFTLEGTKPA